MIDILIVLLILSWLGGVSFHVAGDLIHTLLVVALIMVVVRLARGQRIT